MNACSYCGVLPLAPVTNCTQCGGPVREQRGDGVRIDSLFGYATPYPWAATMVSYEPGAGITSKRISFEDFYK